MFRSVALSSLNQLMSSDDAQHVSLGGSGRRQRHAGNSPTARAADGRLSVSFHKNNQKTIFSPWPSMVSSFFWNVLHSPAVPSLSVPLREGFEESEADSPAARQGFAAAVERFRKLWKNDAVEAVVSSVLRFCCSDAPLVITGRIFL